MSGSKDEKDWLKVFVDQLVENATKQPGWLPLSVIVYLAVLRFPLPATVSAWGHPVPISTEVLAGLLTLAFYRLGDALDKISFNTRIDGKWVARCVSAPLEKAKDAARDALGVSDGSYSVAMSLLEAADEFRVRVHAANEFAKFARSVAPPLVGVLIWTAVARLSPVPAVAATLALLLLLYVFFVRVYPPLKNVHIRNLYLSIPELVQRTDRNRERYFRTALVAPDICFFFWNAKFVTACPTSRPAGTQTSVHSE